MLRLVSWLLPICWVNGELSGCYLDSPESYLRATVSWNGSRKIVHDANTGLQRGWEEEKKKGSGGRHYRGVFVPDGTVDEHCQHLVHVACRDVRVNMRVCRRASCVTTSGATVLPRSQLGEEQFEAEKREGCRWIHTSMALTWREAEMLPRTRQ